MIKRVAGQRIERLPGNEELDAVHKHHVYKIPLGLFGTGIIQGQLAKVNKLAQKLQAPPIWIEVTTEPIEIQRPDNRILYMLELVIAGEAPRVNGFELAARLEHTPNGNLISTRTASPGELAAYRDAPPVCEHCATARRRGDTFLVRAVDTGQLKQIGRNCLADYIRDANAEALMRMWSLLHQLQASCIEEPSEFGGSWGGYCTVSTYAFLSCAVASVRMHGFRPTSNPDSNTKGEATFLSSPRPTSNGYGSERLKAEWDAGQPTEADCERASAIIGWADTLRGSSDYEHNLRVACLSKGILDKARGLLASAPTAYDKARGYEAKRAIEKAAAEGITSEPLGEPKVRVRGMRAQVQRVRRIDRDEGTSVDLVVFLTEREGKTLRLVWWASSLLPECVREGNTVELTGTVKKYETSKHDGKGQTVLSRCAAKPIEQEVISP